MGDGQKAWQMLLSTAPTSEAFSPRTVLTENISRCVQQIKQKTSRITFSCLASAAPQADSWWFGHVVPDEVVMADITGQALDIFRHVPESTHKNGIVKTFTDTSIPTQPYTLLKETKNKTLNSPNMTPSFTCPLPVQCGGRRRPGSLADVPQTYFSTVQSLCRRIASKDKYSLTHPFPSTHAHY